MTRRPARLLLTAGFLLVLLLIIGRAAVEFYTDALWFSQVGYPDVLWRRLGAIAALRFVTGSLGAAIVLLNLGRVVRHLGPVQLRRRYGNLEIAEQVPHGYVTTGILVASILAGFWLSGLAFPREAALAALAWVHRGTWGVSDPVFHRDLSFFVFTLPLVSRLLDFVLLVTVWSAVLALVGYVLVGAVRLRGGRVEIENHPKLHFSILVAAVILLFALRYWLQRYDVLFNGGGFAGGVGYTDVTARLPAYLILSLVCVATAGGIIYAAMRRNWVPALICVGALLLAGIGLGIAYPSLVQKLRVVPNELEREAPFIRWNIEFTRRAWDVELDSTSFPVEADRAPTAAELTSVFRHLPLWDLEPVQTNFVQRASGYSYYHFPSVHFDRYGPPGNQMQVAIAAREFTESGLPANTRTWSTLHLNADQVRGHGAVVAPVAEKTTDGNPILWLLGMTERDDTAPGQTGAAVPPQLTLDRPSIFVGDTSDTRGRYLILNESDSTTDEGIAARAGGIRLGSFFRRFSYVWRFGDRNLLFARELTRDSRLLFRRGVRERLREVAPFIAWDRRPYPVIASGRIVWLVDGYTYTAGYPLAQSSPLPEIGSVRYLRNSVKATVDALTGAMVLYAVRADEPILAAYARAFPGLLQPLETMPTGLHQHLRYPLQLLALQADILEKYHVEDAAAFFSGQNEWQVPQEPTAAGGGRDYAPLYMMARAPGRQAPSFLLVAPFIARDRQNMTAILLVENDAESYGRKTLLEIPRTQQVSGPRQVRTIIEQDPTISAQLSLWRTSGSDVELGRLRVVPLERSILYVQPIFLASSGTSIPQLQRIIVSDGTSVAMGETLESAVGALLGSTQAEEPYAAETPATGDAAMARRALELMDLAERALRAFDWAEFGRRWAELQNVLRRAARE
jgi:uncharacterized membrane protein (UPF0182 family)